MQYYQLDKNQLEEYGYLESEAVFGMDQFIGDSGLISKGIGTKMVNAMSEYLEKELLATAIVMDPHVTNLRSIKCYEKCGLVKKRVLKVDYWLMEKKGKGAV